MMLSLLILLLHASAAADTDYVEYFPGCASTNLIISCPHDGLLKPDSIPDRQDGCYDAATDECDYHHDCGTSSRKCRATTVRDTYTSRVGKAMQAAVAELTGCAPHLVVMNLARLKMDPNRDIVEAAQYDPNAEAAYLKFHGYIQTAHDAVAAANNGVGLHLDVHGQAHSDKWIEVGYALSRTSLNDGDLDKDIASIKALADRAAVSFSQLLSGPKSLGAMLQNKGFKSVPSPRYPKPSDGTEGKYYSGGYITRRWGSRDQGEIDAIQLEMPYHVRKFWTTNGAKIAEVVVEFMNEYYN